RAHDRCRNRARGPLYAVRGAGPPRDRRARRRALAGTCHAGRHRFAGGAEARQHDQLRAQRRTPALRNLAARGGAGRALTQLAPARGRADRHPDSVMLRSLDRSIRLKLLMVVTITTFSALLLTAAGPVSYDRPPYENSSINDLLTQAELVGRSSAPALQFDDPISAKQNLDLLRVRPRISAAAIYRADGSRFADYRKDAAG